MSNRILYVPWQPVESIKHYARRRGVPTSVDKFGNLVFDLEKTRNNAPWAYLMQPLIDHGVLNPAKYQNESKHQFDTRNASMQSQAAAENFPGSEYHSKNKHWKKAEASKAGDKDWFEVWYTGRISPIIMSLRADDQIYIRGHGHPGDTAIHSGAWKLDAEEVARRLIASGLQTHFSGKIKCYNYHSADSGIGTAFAQSLADYLYSSDYKSCQYFGYLGALDSYPGANDAKPSSEKEVKVQQPGQAFKTSQYEDKLFRASSLRQQITPQKKS